MRRLARFHTEYVHGRRVRVLSEHLGTLLETGSKVLDIGCGDGLLASLVKQKKTGLQIEGIDIAVRKSTHVPVTAFDGQTIPHPDKSFDVVMLVDVLHHTDDPMVLLREAKRVARKSILIKDHTMNGIAAKATLSFMDWVGNARYGVPLPYNYWPRWKWIEAFSALGLRKISWQTDLRLYPKFADWAFGRSLHFIALLGIT